MGDNVFVRCHFEVGYGFLVECVTSLLKHGAKLNEVQRTESGVKLESNCLTKLLATPACVHFWDSNYLETAILLLIHGACVAPARVITTLTNRMLDQEVRLHPNPEGHSYQRFLRYFRCSGFIRYKDPVYTNTQHQRQFGLSTQTLSLKPLQESLEFKCRRVIRQQMSIAADGKSILDGIDDLQLSVNLRGYLKFEDAEQLS